MRNFITVGALSAALFFAACLGSSPSTSGQRHSLSEAGTCGDGVCDPGETHDTCANDCCQLSDGSGGGSGYGSGGGSGHGSGAGAICQAQCGNGFCDGNETHSSCPSDCCETTGDGYCVAHCGNGFCEAGEDHASCPGDCCETTGDGACVAQCGNGFCETGETAASCPADCH